ncbi:MAG: hypothetical protein KGS72_05475 [Cyanobacteria bacterium REEB67]|nr:hypothetical protein [Cyanobacteria bacterium REEB67]
MSLPSKESGTTSDAKMLPVISGLSRLEEINRQILLQEIALEKHSINYRHYHNVQGRWKGWRYFLSQEGNNVLTGAGLAYQLAERARIFKHPYILSTAKVVVTDKQSGVRTTALRPVGLLQHPSRAKLEAGAYPQMVGQSLGMCGSALELGINAYHRHQATRVGYECRSSIKQVKGYKDNFERLFAERDAIIAGGSIAADDLPAAKAEGKLLRATTTLSLQEYEDFHVNTRRNRSMQDTLYVFDISRNAAGVAGNIVGLVGYHEASGYLSGPASVLVTISGALGALMPVAARGYGKLAGERHRRLIRRTLGKCNVCTMADYDLDRKNLQRLIAQKKERGDTFSEKALTLLGTYEGTAIERFEQEELAQRDYRAGVRAAQQNIIVGGVTGTSKVALGVTGVIAGYGLQTANHRSNDLLVPGTIAYMSGSWLAAADNIRLRVVDEMNRHRLTKQGLMPAQVLAARVKMLDEMDRTLHATE